MPDWKPEDALELLRFAELYAKVGRLDLTAKYLRKAAEIYRELGSTGWAEELCEQADALRSQVSGLYPYAPLPEPPPECLGRGALPLPPPAARGKVHMPPPLLFIDPQRLPAVRTQILEPPEVSYTPLPRVDSGAVDSALAAAIARRLRRPQQGS